MRKHRVHPDATAIAGGKVLLDDAATEKRRSTPNIDSSAITFSLLLFATNHVSADDAVQHPRTGPIAEYPAASGLQWFSQRIDGRAVPTSQSEATQNGVTTLGASECRDTSWVRLSSVNHRLPSHIGVGGCDGRNQNGFAQKVDRFGIGAGLNQNRILGTACWIAP
jgi:hypothetical protein